MDNDQTVKESPGRPRQRELVRPAEGRVVAGVARGLADTLDIPTWVPRAFFVITTFFGGLGIALYLAAWALIRSEDETESPAARFIVDASGPKSWIGIGLIFLATVILLDNFTFLHGGVVWAAGLLVVGILLYTGHMPKELTRRAPDTGGATSDPTPEESGMTSEDTEAATPETGGGASRVTTSDPTRSPTPSTRTRERSVLGQVTLGITLLGLGVLALLDTLPASRIDPGPRHYLALALAFIGVGLLVGSVVGRARWLILVGVILIPTLVFSPFVEIVGAPSDFSQVTQPSSFESLQTDHRVDLGRLVIDLTVLPWDGRTIELNARVDAGTLKILVPEEVGIRGKAEVEVGSISAPGKSSAGIDPGSVVFDEQGEAGTVLLDARVDIGTIEIRR